MDVDDLHLLYRIRYAAPSDEKWCENEIDYILFVRKDVKISPNHEEVMDTMVCDAIPSTMTHSTLPKTS